LTTTTDPPLHDLVARYVAWRENKTGQTVTEATARHYGHCINSLGRYLGRPPQLSDLTPTTINTWIARQLSRGKSLAYVHSQRIGVLVIWRFAHRTGLTCVWPDGILQTTPNRSDRAADDDLPPVSSSRVA